MDYRVRKETVVDSMEVLMDEQAQVQYVPTSFKDQIRGSGERIFEVAHTIKTFSKIRSAVKFLRSLKQKLTDEV